MQWLVHDGTLEADGVTPDELDTMRLKYEGLSDAARHWHAELEDGSATMRDLDGFRLLRKRRMRREEIAAGNMCWRTVEVRNSGVVRQLCAISMRCCARRCAVALSGDCGAPLCRRWLHLVRCGVP